MSEEFEPKPLTFQEVRDKAKAMRPEFGIDTPQKHQVVMGFVDGYVSHYDLVDYLIPNESGKPSTPKESK